MLIKDQGYTIFNHAKCIRLAKPIHVAVMQLTLYQTMKYYTGPI